MYTICTNTAQVKFKSSSKRLALGNWEGTYTPSKQQLALRCVAFAPFCSAHLHHGQLVCFALLHSVCCSLALLLSCSACSALLVSALLCYMLSFALLCSALLFSAQICFELHCSVPLCFCFIALLCSLPLCSSLLCSALVPLRYCFMLGCIAFGYLGVFGPHTFAST